MGFLAQEFRHYLPQKALRVVVFCLFLTGCCLFGNQANAGCHLNTAGAAKEQFAGFTEHTLPEHAWWTVGPVERLYEGGRFIYYQVSTPLRPCNQPGCRGSVPEPKMSMPSATHSNRVSTLSLRSANAITTLLPDSSCEIRADGEFDAWVNPILDGPLRPPCTLA